MCTKKETKDSLREVLLEKDKDGNTVVSRAVEDHIEEKIASLLTSLTIRGMWGAVALVIAGTTAWVSLNHQVQTNSEKLTEGGRYTQEEHNVYSAEVDRRFLEMDADIADIKTDLRLIRQATVGY